MSSRLVPALDLRVGRVPVTVGADALLLLSVLLIPGLPFPEASALLLALVLALVLHEAGHALAANALGLRGVRIRFGLGGLCSYDAGERSPGREALISLAGPVANLALAGACWALLAAMPPAWTLIVERLLWVDLALAAVNLVPLYPLDGGQTALALLLWRGVPADRARRAALRLSLTTAALAAPAAWWWGGSWSGGALLLLAIYTGMAWRDLR